MSKLRVHDLFIKSTKCRDINLKLYTEEDLVKPKRIY